MEAGHEFARRGFPKGRRQLQNSPPFTGHHVAPFTLITKVRVIKSERSAREMYEYLVVFKGDDEEDEREGREREQRLRVK